MNHSSWCSVLEALSFACSQNKYCINRSYCFISLHKKVTLIVAHMQWLRICAEHNYYKPFMFPSWDWYLYVPVPKLLCLTCHLKWFISITSFLYKALTFFWYENFMCNGWLKERIGWDWVGRYACICFLFAYPYSLLCWLLDPSLHFGNFVCERQW